MTLSRLDDYVIYLVRYLFYVSNTRLFSFICGNIITRNPVTTSILLRCEAWICWEASHERMEEAAAQFNQSQRT